MTQEDSRIRRFLPAAVVLTAFFLRLYDLDGFCLFWDEWFGQGWNNNRTAWQMCSAVFEHDVHPPLYYLIVRFFLNLPLELETALRLPSVFMGAAGVYATYRLGLLLFGFEAAITSSLFLTLHPMHFYHSQEARMYSLLYLVSACLLIAWVNYTKKGGSRQLNWLIAASVAAFYSHYYMIFPLIFIACCFVARIREKREIAGFAYWSGAVVAISLPLLVMAKALPFNVGFRSHLFLNANWLPQAGYSELLENLRKLGEGYFFSFSAPWSVVLIIMILVSSFVSSCRERRRADQLLLSAYFILPLVLLFFVSAMMKSVFGSPIYEERHSMFCLPAIAVLAGYAISRLGVFRHIVICALLLLFLQNNLDYVARRDISLSLAGSFLSTTCKNTESVLVAPFALCTQAVRYASPAALPFSEPGSSPEQAAERVERIIGSGPFVLIWRDIGQLIGEGTEPDLTGREYLKRKYGLYEAAAFYTPHAWPGSLKVLFPGNPRKGVFRLKLDFSGPVRFKYYREGNFSGWRTANVYRELSLDLEPGVSWRAELYRWFPFMPFYRPFLIMPVLHAASPGEAVAEIRLPFYFSAAWVLLMNASWMLMFLLLRPVWRDFRNNLF
ncbi:MAG: glycosyltransferase family 39 protein [Candidatus Wallbacteria bacterium]|nr:glycosyltransferase family 39 protein [Candidatus Wallbacteria bacterium]